MFSVSTMGTGMPQASDYRDLPHVWAKGFYRMDVDRLTARLTTAQLILGDVAQTIPEWVSPMSCLSASWRLISTILAIRDFNEAHPAPWNDQMYVMHDFAHTLYCVNITPKDEAYTQHPLL
jgi:hypothetical protein